MSGSSGVLIALEGLDNAGKTTMLRSIKAAFKSSESVVVTRELTTWLGRVIKPRIRRLSSHDKVLLFAADRQLRMEGKIAPALARGALCVADRWVTSALAYRCAENAALEEYVRRVNAIFPVPSLTILISISAQESIRRGLRLKKNNYPVEFLAEVEKQYRRLAEGGEAVTINGMVESRTVRAEVEDLIRETLRARG